MKKKDRTQEQLAKEIQRLRCRVAELENSESEHKKIEEKLQESQARYQALFDRTLYCVFVHDFDGRFLDANDAAFNLLGYTRKEFPATLASLLDQDQLAIAIKRDKEIRRTGVSSEPFEYRLKKKSGGYVWVEVESSLIYRGGKPYAIQGIARDITARKQAEEELHRGYQQLRETFIETVNALASTVEMKDPYTAGHQRWATRLACSIAKEMGLSEEQIEGIRMAGLIHDIGKINIPAEILSKPGQLSDIQYNMVKIHPQVGCDILREIKFPWPVAQIVLQHHERMNGSGYPEGISGEEIILEARILAVADTVEAMSSHRPYRAAHGIERALEEISRNRGTLYDPEVVDACLTLFEKGFRFD
jgi:PAS domain S-box-containing protein/putative nucleotidyltransferase with HDIG domain